MTLPDTCPLCHADPFRPAAAQLTIGYQEFDDTYNGGIMWGSTYDRAEESDTLEYFCRDCGETLPEALQQTLDTMLENTRPRQGERDTIIAGFLDPPAQAMQVN